MCVRGGERRGRPGFVCKHDIRELVDHEYEGPNVRGSSISDRASIDVCSLNAVFQRQDGIGRRSRGKERCVRSVTPAGRCQRSATDRNGRRPSWTAWCALSPTATAAVMLKTNLCIGPFCPGWPQNSPGNGTLKIPHPEGLVGFGLWGLRGGGGGRERSALFLSGGGWK